MTPSSARRSLTAVRSAARMRLGHLLAGSSVLVAFLAGASPARAASEFMHLTAATLHQVPDSLCGKFLQAGADAPDLPAMLAYVDSSSMDRWAIMLERMVRARARSAPGARVATATEVRAAYAAIPGRLSVEDRQRMIWIARNPPPTQQDACWAMRVIMDGLAQLPLAELGPVVGLTFGETPGARAK